MSKPHNMSFSFGVVLLVFFTVFFAELPDKTSLTSVTLASRHSPVWVWLGASAAFFGQTVLAVAAGTVIGAVPHPLIRVASGLGFLAIAIFMGQRHADPHAAATETVAQARSSAWQVAAQAGVLVFLAEFGDLTQFAIAALEARFAEPLAVFAGAWFALAAAAGLAVIVGSKLGSLLAPGKMQRIAAVVFGVLGAGVLLGIGAAV